MLLQGVAGFLMRRGKSSTCAALRTAQLRGLDSAFMLLEPGPAVLLQSVAGCLETLYAEPKWPNAYHGADTEACPAVLPHAQ